MRKFYYLLLFVSSVLQAQEYTTSEKSVTGTFTSSKSKSELFASINKWISINYNSAQNVIQMNDAESGTIIIKGINEVTYSNLPGKVLMPNNKMVPEKTTTKFNHTIEVNVRENKFRIIYTITGVASADPAGEIFSGPFFNAINLNGDNSDAVNLYNEQSEKFLKQGMIGKEKREKYRLAVIEMFKELNKNIADNMKATMLSIEKSSAIEDKW